MSEPSTGAADGFELTAEQLEALALGHNIAVTAGAGTGKTTTLTERYRRILRDDPSIGPDRILVLTFTNATENELHDEIRDLIAEELQRVGTAAETEAEAETEAGVDTYHRWRDAMDDVEDAYIHTIHGFCARILREFAVEAGVHPDFETLDETDAGVRFAEAMTTVLDRHAADDREDGAWTAEPTVDTDIVADDLERLTVQYSRRQLESVLGGLYAERPDSETWAERWGDASVADCREAMLSVVDGILTRDDADDLMAHASVQAAVDELLALGAMDIPISTGEDAGMATLTSLVTRLEETGAHTPAGDAGDRQRFLLAVADAVTNADGKWQSQAWRYAGSAARWADHGYEGERERLQTALEQLGEAIDVANRTLAFDPDRARSAARLGRSLARVFEAVMAEYHRVNRLQNAFDYADLITETTTFLAEHEDVRRTLAGQFEHILVDEVQDTDPRQWEILRLLSGDDPDRFDGGNVFMVGDAKQSIYRFREADVTAFRDARDRLVAEAPDPDAADLALTTNFRTVESTLAVLNAIFDEVLRPADHEVDPVPDHEPYEAAPQPLTACRTEGTAVDGQVEYLLVPADEDADAALGLDGTWYTADRFVSTADREATAVAARLSALFADEVQVYDPDEKAYTPARPEHVALLFRSSHRIGAFERALDDHDIPYTSLAGGGFYETPEIRPLINLLRVLEDPTADIPLYGVLRSPLFGFTDAEIAGARRADASLWTALLTAPEAALRGARTRIESWRSAVGIGDDPAEYGRWSDLVSRVIDDTGYLVGIGADERPRQALANVDKFRHQLRGWEAATARSVTDLLGRIERERERGEDPSQATIPDAIEGVQLRTIHSAKGLEFPIVVIPEIDRQFVMRSSLPGAYFETIDGEPIMGLRAPNPNSPFEIEPTAAYEAVKAQHHRLERAEQRRLLYVAATRARDHLFVSGTHEIDPDTENGLAESGDWAEANRWTDWLQPTLLGVPDLVGRLREDGRVPVPMGEGSVTIRPPIPPGDWVPAREEGPVPTAIEIPRPDVPDRRAHLSATGFRKVAATAPDRPAILRLADGSGRSANGDTAGNRSPVESIDPQTLGTIVHRLCELDRPAAEWPRAIRRLVDDPETISERAIETISEHVTVAKAEVDRLEASLDVRSRHAELPVRLDLDRVRIVGEIDHLLVTDSGSLVVDYKTDRIGEAAIEELAEEYLPQVMVYASAVRQGTASDGPVEAAIVFTDAKRHVRVSPTDADLDAFCAWADRIV